MQSGLASLKLISESTGTRVPRKQGGALSDKKTRGNVKKPGEFARMHLAD